MYLSDTLTKTGIFQNIETKLFGDNGYGKITDDTDRTYLFTNLCNRALDRFSFLAMTADGVWQWDDDNYTTQSIATTNLVTTQREYQFALDHLEIEAVLVKDSSGIWRTLTPFDQRDPNAKAYLENNATRSGMPTRYDKRGTTLWLDVTPNFNSTAGLKVYFKRGPSYFTYSDTNKAPGFASNFHSFVVNYASTYYALDRTMPQAVNWYQDLQKEEKAIQSFYSSRSKDEKPKFKILIQNNR